MQYENRPNSEVPYILKCCDPCAVFKSVGWIAGYEGRKVKGAYKYPGQDLTQDLGERPIRFIHSIYGINAGCSTVIYHHAHGLNTIRKVISVYAPPSENDTETYIRLVSDRLKVTADDIYDPKDEKTLSALIRIIIRIECGPTPPKDLPSHWVPEKDIDYGVQMGLGKVSNKVVPPTPPKPRGDFRLTEEEAQNLIVPLNW
jgi:hypothetical protein